MSWFARKSAYAALAALSAMLFSMTAALAPAGAASTPNCTPKTNIEAIIDDSGSMSGTDPNTLRVQGMNLLIDSLPAKTELGALKFGSGLAPDPPATSLFSPEPVGPNAVTMKKILIDSVHSESGGTDYNGAFALSDAADPNAQARIFLTDGGHNAGEYNNGHLVRNVPTYVIGFGVGLESVTDQERLQRIAAETGGAYYLLSETSQVQPLFNSLGATLTCQTPPQSFTDKLKSGQSKPHSVAIGASTKSIQIALTWANPTDKFKLTDLRLVSGGRAIAVASGRKPKPRKLKVTVTPSKTFSLVKVSGLSRGRLHFKVAAKSVVSEPQVSVTTQLSQRSTR